LKFFKNSLAVFQILTGKWKGTNGTDGSSFEVVILQQTAAEFILQELSWNSGRKIRWLLQLLIMLNVDDQNLPIIDCFFNI
jgi:hypothetical protein